MLTRFEELQIQAAASAGTGTPMPIYKCYKEVWAFKIAEIHRETLPVWSGATCRGSYALGTACGKCERCKWELSHGPGMGAMIVAAEKHFAPFFVSAEYLSKHKPEVGGYYVVYKDGYKSFSPAQAFEEGYVKV